MAARIRHRRLAGILAALLGAAIAHDALQARAEVDPGVTERRAFKGARLTALRPTGTIPTASPQDLAQALDVSPSALIDAVYGGSSSASGVFSGLGVLHPLRGETFAVLSSGVVGTSAPEPGIDFSPVGAGGDAASLTLNLRVPLGQSRLHFGFNFLSAEYPDFVGTIYNDTFRVTLHDASGTREIAFASVNSSFFFPASEGRAGGSGFDIFTPEPDGVDTAFPGGLPDAGLTDWQFVDEPVSGGAPVTLTFSIGDLGDGILDSAVILDALSISSLEALDPNPTLLGSDGKVTSNLEDLASAAESREGAAADGVTRLLVRTATSGAGSVEFSLVDATAPADGGLAAIGADGRSQRVVTSATNTAEGWFAFALYQVPDDFTRPGDEGLSERPVKLRAVFTPTAGEQSTSDLTLRLVRPPLVLVHGLWSGPETWTFALASDTRFRIEPTNYAATHASWFYVNEPIVADSFRQAITRLRRQDIAATQVDVAGHSMGGVLTRRVAARPGYRRKDNFLAGDVHELLTLDSPHAGSPIANLVVGIRSIPLIGSLFKAAMNKLDKAVDQGALDDLSIGSAPLAALPEMAAPSHALVGIGGSDALALIPGWIGQFYRVVNFFADTTGLFQGFQHDGIVGRISQEGGLPDSQTSVFGGIDGIHIFNGGSESYSSRLVELLNTDVSSPLFGRFGANAVVGFSAAQPQFTPFGATSVIEGLTIVSPAAGATVTPGSTVHVVVQALPGQTVSSVLLVGPDTAEVDDQAPFEFDLAVPASAIGSFTIDATGKDGQGAWYTTDHPVSLFASPTAALTAIHVIPHDPIIFGVGQIRSLVVVGDYDDGVSREITKPETGTTYLSSTASVVSVDEHGAVTANGPGIATLVAQNSALQDSVSATVIEVTNQPPTAIAGSDQTLECAGAGTAVASVDGSDSNDPDNDVLTCSWTSATCTFGNAADCATTASCPLGPNTATLVVTDTAGESDADDLGITVRDTQAPIGTITSPPAGACFGPASIPVTVVDTFSDGCDPALNRSYSPSGGPAYSAHGDYHVVLTATDDTLNASTGSVDFIIDRLPPTITITQPAVDQVGLPPVTIPITIQFQANDSDGAAGGVLREVVKLMDTCVLWDGNTYGDRDGLLSDEAPLQITKYTLCQAMARCGFLVLYSPKFRVEETDCGGNVGSADRVFRLRLLKTEVCAP